MTHHICLADIRQGEDVVKLCSRVSMIVSQEIVDLVNHGEFDSHQHMVLDISFETGYPPQNKDHA